MTPGRDSATASGNSPSIRSDAGWLGEAGSNVAQSRVPAMTCTAAGHGGGRSLLGSTNRPWPIPTFTRCGQLRQKGPHSPAVEVTQASSAESTPDSRCTQTGVPAGSDIRNANASPPLGSGIVRGAVRPSGPSARSPSGAKAGAAGAGGPAACQHDVAVAGPGVAADPQPASTM